MKYILEYEQYITIDGYYRIKGITYYYYPCCGNCSEPFLSVRKSGSKFCTNFCCSQSEEIRQIHLEVWKGRYHTEETKQKMSEAHRGKQFSEEHKKKLGDSKRGRPLSEEHKQKMSIAQKGHSFRGGNSKGGVTAKNIALYDTYAPQLELYEQCRRTIDDPDHLEVKCAYCGKWHKPRATDVYNRIYAINNGIGNYQLYCSKGCKQECPIYRQHKHYKGYKYHGSREVQPQLRQMVFERDNWTCQKCGSKEHLHCHHKNPVIDDPIESCDMEDCIAYCNSCHKEAHKQPGCTYAELRICKWD